MTLLVHIGMHKTATTWMRKYLFTEAHGFTLLNRVMAENSFDRTGVFDFDPGAVRAQFAEAIATAEQNEMNPVISLEHFTGTPFNRGLTLPLYAERLKTAFPDAKILLVIREQQALIASWYSLYVRSGGACSIHDFMQPPDHGAWSPVFRFDFLKYDGIIALYRRLFGEDNLCVLPYEQFREMPQEFVQNILAYTSHPAPDAGSHNEIPDSHSGFRDVQAAIVENPARSALSIAMQRRLNPLLQRGESNGWSPLALPGAHKLADPLFAHLGALVPVPVERYISRRRTQAVEVLCAGRFGESNRRTVALTGLDLASHGYAL